MDEATLAKALQTDLNFHKVRIQVKRVEGQLYILASRDEEHSINYEFLFSLMQTRLEQLKIHAVEGFTLYGRVIGSKEPEWRKFGTLIHDDLSSISSHFQDNVNTLVVVDGKVEKVEPERDPSHVFPQPTRLVNTVNPSQNRTGLFIFLSVIGIVAVGGIFLLWRSQQKELTVQAQTLISTKAFNPKQPYALEILEGDRLNASDTLLRLKAIPDLPFSLHQEAQALIPSLQMQLGQIEQKLVVERKAIDALNSAQKIAEDAMAIAKNPPHPPKIWRQAQAKWQRSLQVVRAIPESTFAKVQAQEKIKVYDANYKSVSFQLKQQLVNDAITYFLKTDTGIGIQLEMRDLKSTQISKIEFMDVCTPFVSFNLDPSQVKAQQVDLSTLSVEMCNYLWKRK